MRLMFRRIAEAWTPPPDIGTTDWAERYRYLAPEASALPGKYSVSLTPWIPGIHQALVSGRLAGEEAAAFVEGDETALERYEPSFRELFDVHLGRATERRREMMATWEGAMGDPEAFDRVARRGWIGFKEYYSRGGGGPDG